MNLNWDIVGLRTLVKPRVQRRFIDDLVSAIEATDVVRLPALHPPHTLAPCTTSSSSRRTG